LLLKVESNEVERCQKIVPVNLLYTAGNSGIEALIIPSEGSTEVKTASGKTVVLHCFFALGFANSRIVYIRATVIAQILCAS